MQLQAIVCPPLVYSIQNLYLYTVQVYSVLCTYLYGMACESTFYCSTTDVMV